MYLGKQQTLLEVRIWVPVLSQMYTNARKRFRGLLEGFVDQHEQK